MALYIAYIPGTGEEEPYAAVFSKEKDLGKFRKKYNKITVSKYTGDTIPDVIFKAEKKIRIDGKEVTLKKIFLNENEANDFGETEEMEPTIKTVCRNIDENIRWLYLCVFFSILFVGFSLFFKTTAGIWISSSIFLFSLFFVILLVIMVFYDKSAIKKKFYIQKKSR